ncbi:gag-pol polyprotein [Cucumis melo var. makuwa]|uniref:Gag-pol polyprotein n=1 Tax=Cucumis melo var. makuwa TaxID=1194695 RepID=A0A5A7SVG0_CUCMM|nr:gag-pol polyprotein [Cucumis melo var. makuwa]TYK07573.1 gag-pol polyprotein [Cucumis melo var. makuwa]
MEIIREGPSASRPLVLDGKNYSYWKPRMIFFIKTLDRRAWRVLVAGYEPPMMTVDGVSIPKSKVDWIDDKEQASFSKEAWKILEVAYESTTRVKISRLQLITSKFEALKMFEDESISEYNERVLEIANESLLFGKRIPESKIVRKVLRSLPEKFDMKIECPTFLRRQKKNLRAILSDEDPYDSEEDNDMNAFTIRITKTNFEDESESSKENCDNELTFEKLKVLWKEDSEARTVQKVKIQELMKENEHLMSVISSLKLKLREVQNEYDQTMNSVKMLNFGTVNLDLILRSGQTNSSKYGLDFDSLVRNVNPTTKIKFVPTSVNDKLDAPTA